MSFQLFFSQNHPHVPIKIILLFDDQTDIPNLGLFPFLIPIELPRIVFPIADGCPYKFRSSGTQDLQCLPRFSAICVVEDVSIRLDNLT